MAISVKMQKGTFFLLTFVFMQNKLSGKKTYSKTTKSIQPNKQKTAKAFHFCKLRGARTE